MLSPGLRLRLPVASIAVVLAALVAYVGTLGFDFVWDDTLLIQRRDLHHWKDLWAALTSHFWAAVPERNHYYYRPLVTASFIFDLRIWGLNPLGFHLTNVL